MARQDPATFTHVRILKTTNEKIRKAKIKSRYLLSAGDIVDSALELYLKKQKRSPNFK